MLEQTPATGEALAFDFVASIPTPTPFISYMCNNKLSYIRNLSNHIEHLSAPTAEDIMFILRDIIGIGISQKILSNKLGVTTGTLSRWVSGDNPPRDFMRKPIAKELKTIIDEAAHKMVKNMEKWEVGADRPPFAPPPVEPGHPRL